MRTVPEKKPHIDMKKTACLFIGAILMARSGLANEWTLPDLPTLPMAHAGSPVFSSHGVGRLPASVSAASASNRSASGVNNWVEWTGYVSNKWSEPLNWSSSAVPTMFENVRIMLGAPRYPVLDVDGEVGNLDIEVLASVSLNHRTLRIYGIVTGLGTFRGSPFSQIRFMTDQSPDTAKLRFQGTRDDQSLATLSLKGRVKLMTPLLIIYNELLLESARFNLDHNELVLRSTFQRTARIGDITGSDISGATNVTVERYIPRTLDANNRGRRWRLLTAPLYNLSINSAWQNGNAWNGIAPLAQLTGTLINGNRMPDAVTANKLGYDFWSSVTRAGASICRYEPNLSFSQGRWETIGTTLFNNAFSIEPAYLLYVRGPRFSEYSSGTASMETTLRPNGFLKMGTFTSILMSNVRYTLIGNPYASALDFDVFYKWGDNSANIKRQFWLWDASLGDAGNYRLIKYMNGQYLSMPEGMPTDLTFIQSGTGFFVESREGFGGVVVITESHKTNLTPQPVNVLLSHARKPGLRVLLLRTEAGAPDVVMDEVASVMDDAYRKAPVDEDDVMRPGWSDGHLSILRDNLGLTLNACPIPKTVDTLSLQTNKLAEGSYLLRVILQDPGGQLGPAWLLDRQTRRMTALSTDGGGLVYPFTLGVEDTAFCAQRFRIILPRRSHVVEPTSEDASEILRVWPNPSVGRSFYLQSAQLVAGDYSVEVYGADGMLVARKPWKHAGGGSVLRVELPWAMPSGRYSVRLTGGPGALLQAELFVK